MMGRLEMNFFVTTIPQDVSQNTIYINASIHIITLIGEELVDSSQDDAREWMTNMANIMGSLGVFSALSLIVGAIYAIR